jgi:hypothetical protein
MSTPLQMVTSTSARVRALERQLVDARAVRDQWIALARAGTTLAVLALAAGLSSGMVDRIAQSRGSGPLPLQREAGRTPAAS